MLVVSEQSNLQMNLLYLWTDGQQNSFLSGKAQVPVTGSTTSPTPVVPAQLHWLCCLHLTIPRIWDLRLRRERPLHRSRPS